ncbi:MAG: helix-turn-helix domain-containing protein [Cyclobacteriaceae bacterium]
MLIKNTTQNDESNIVFGSILYNTGEERSELLLIPDNKGELFIPLSSDIKLKLIGNAREIKLNADQCYFLKPRRRGMEVLCNENAKFIVVKINPIYVRMFCADLQEISSGIHSMDLSSESLKKLKRANESGKNAVENIIRREAIFLREEGPLNVTVAESIERIRHTSGTIKVREIYSSLNVSKSKLEQHFNREIGLSPKEFCKIEKINYFINSYEKNENQNLTELTYKCGYYDQSHLIKDFRYFLDTSPKKFFASRVNSLS